MATSMHRDAGWYNRLVGIGEQRSYNHYLAGDHRVRDEQQAAFLAGKRENPHLDYPQLKRTDFVQQAADLNMLRQELLQTESDPLVRAAYQARLDEAIKIMDMYQAANVGDSVAFTTVSERLFGQPSAAVFAYTINQIRAAAAAVQAQSSQALHRAAAELVELLPDVAATTIALPSERTVQATLEHVRQSIAELIAIPDERAAWDSHGITDSVQRALVCVGATDWQCRVSPGNYFMVVDQGRKMVGIPYRRVIRREKMCKLLVHEIGTHVVRRINGEASSLNLLASGLANYERGEEGVATLYEEVVIGQRSSLIRPERYLSIGLAKGLDGTPRVFQEVFRVMERYYRFKLLRRNIPENQVADQASLEAWHACVRTFRGTDCVTPGACFTKDIIYQDGNLAVWDILQREPEELHRFFLGKYDPANATHRQLLDGLGLTRDHARSIADTRRAQSAQ